MDFITEVKQHPQFIEFMKKDPVAGRLMLINYMGSFKKEWPGFIEERNKLRQAFRFQQDAYSEKKTFRQVAVYPAIVSIWLKFLNGGGDSSKGFQKEYLKKHKEYWIVDEL